MSKGYAHGSCNFVRQFFLKKKKERKKKRNLSALINERVICAEVGAHTCYVII